MKCKLKSTLRIFLVVILITILLPLLPAAPVFADSSHTWTTKADFDAGVLTNVDTSYSPGDVLLAVTIDTGTGAFDFLDVDDTTTTDWRKAAVVLTSAAGQNRVYVNTASGPFYATDEVLIIQMKGTGAGKWETRHVQSVETEHLVLTENMENTYYANPGDTYNKAQVIMVPQFKDVTVKNGGVLTCDAWNGSTGGIVFFRSTGTVTVEPGGRIDVSGKGFAGGAGGYGGSGGQGGHGGAGGYDYGKHHATAGGVSGTGGTGGGGGCGACWAGADGALKGYDGNGGGLGNTGTGPAGGPSDQGGMNGSVNNLSLLQLGSGGGGGSGGQGGYGGGGTGGGGEGDLGNGYDGDPGATGGTGGTGGAGGQGAGAIIICAEAIIIQGNVVAAGWSGSTGSTGSNGHNPHSTADSGDGGQGSFVCGGGGGGGGAGSQGGYGGKGGCGGAAGTIWFAADSITLGNSLVRAFGGAGLAGGGGGGGGDGAIFGIGGDTLEWCTGHDGSSGPKGPSGPTGATGRTGASGKIRLDYVTVSGSTSPSPSYASGLYVASGTIASDVLDTGIDNTPWQDLDWLETIPASTDITFEVRASNTSFTKDNNTIPWISVGGTSPVTSGLPSGRYMQWRATLTYTNSFNTPVLHEVTVEYTNAPVVETDTATSIGESSATLNGDLVSFYPASSASVSFEWGITSGSYS